MARKIRSPEELDRVRDEARSDIDVRAGSKDVMITVHMGTCGIAAGARDILTELADELEKGAVQSVTLRRSGCLGLCAREPMMTLVAEDGREFRYGELDGEKVRRIVKEHVMNGTPVVDYLIVDGNKEDR